MSTTSDIIKRRGSRIFNSFIIVLLISVPILSQSRVQSDNSRVQFVDREEALNLILPNLPQSGCVRVPAWELTVGGKIGGGFTAHKPDANCRDMFESAVRDFSDEDKETLTQYVSRVDSVIKAEFPALGSFPWSFVLISDSADFKSLSAVKHIILTDELIAIMRGSMENRSSMKFVGLEILIHEKARVLQLMCPEPFHSFYEEVWGFRKINRRLIDWRSQDRGQTLTSISPKEWVIKASPKDKNYILPGLIRLDGGADGAGSFHRVAITVDSTPGGFVARTRKGKKALLDYKDLSTVSQYRKKFPLSQYAYDPDELSADLIAKYLVMKYISANYGTAPARFVDYSQIEKLMTSVDKVVY